MAQVKPDRSPRRRLNREVVLEAALDLVDGEGIGGLNFRRLGRELGTSTMAAYTYFENKDVLVDAMLEHSLGGLERSMHPASEWDRQVEEAMLALHDRLVGHPGIAELITARPEGDRLSGLRDVLIAIVERAGLDDQQTWDALRALMSYVIGFTALAHNRQPATVHRHSQAAFEYGLQMLMDALRQRVATTSARS